MSTLNIIAKKIKFNGEVLMLQVQRASGYLTEEGSKKGKKYTGMNPEDFKRDMPKEFVEFCRKKGLTHKFVRAFNRDFDYENFRDSCEDLPDSHIVNQSLNWKNTKEGKTFWKYVDSMWQIEYYSKY